MKQHFLLFLIILCSNFAFAQSIAGRSNNFNTKKSLAIDGYDPVSYFSGEPLEGDAQWKYSYEGITYYFANKTNLEKFRSDPSNYEPQFGGWCAFAMGDTGEKVKVDPETFKIRDGKLYLFYNFWGTNTLELWNEKEQELLKKADLNWSTILK